ncbi:hypothetical protein NQ318_000098 [Aromia moschata]|uniref:Magnesium transporter n=1 Tax=Aromia moschata TaxID=1265417 RepID=A0AAV8XHB5_9CUCU|nr:hypothetical protein NQ318_000098 [Aromia moschata]
MESSTKTLNITVYSRTEFYIRITLCFKFFRIYWIQLNKKGCLRASAGGFGYLKDWMWWLGFLTMGVGEAANFVAYAFAPASLVTPLGALSVLVSAVLASKFLKETMTLVGKLGCLLCILGSTVMIIHSPKEQQMESVDELITKLQQPEFINYIILVITIVTIIFFYFGPRYGHRYVAVYVILCSAVGSLSVMACKGLGLAIKDSLSETSLNQPPNPWILVGLLLTVIVCICIQMTYLNKVLDIFSTNVVTPIYYVLFTSLVIVASAILFKEWKRMDEMDIALLLS